MTIEIIETERDPIDLLVYGTGELAELSRRWPAAIAAADVTVSLPEGFRLDRHAGALTLELTVGERAPLQGASRLRQQGAMAASFELFVEPLSPVGDQIGGLEDVPAEAARRIRRSTFCAVLSVSASASRASCIAALFAAAGLARAAAGVVADIDEERYWDADEALAAADSYLTAVMKLDRRPPLVLDRRSRDDR